MMSQTGTQLKLTTIIEAVRRQGEKRDYATNISFF